ncbi:MAG: hypothetical protein AB1489_27410 [Acidobacteriota bacterium]
MGIVLTGLDKTEFGETFHVGAAIVLAPGLAHFNYPATPRVEGLNAEAKWSDEKNRLLELSAAQIAFLEDITTYTDGQRSSIISALSQLQRNYPGQIIDTSGGTVEINKKKCTNEIIYPAFQVNGGRPIGWISAAFLSGLEQETKDNIAVYLNRHVNEEVKPFTRPSPKGLIRIRNKNDDSAWRNTNADIVNMMITAFTQNGITNLIFAGDHMGYVDEIIVDERLQKKLGITAYSIIGFDSDPAFQEIANGKLFAAQLQLLSLLYLSHATLCSVGMMSGALDGPGLMGYPTIFFQEDGKDNRMGLLSGLISSWFIKVPFNVVSKKGNEVIHFTSQQTDLLLQQIATLKPAWLAGQEPYWWGGGKW